MNIQQLLFGIAGAAGGWLLPAGASRLAVWKCSKNGRSMELAPHLTGPAARSICLLSNSVGWALCSWAGPMIPAMLAMLLWSMGILLILLDLRLRLIPNELLLAMLVTGIILQVLISGIGNLPQTLFVALTVTVVFISLGNFMGLYKIGAGDVKLAALIALTLGFPWTMAAMMAMAASMLVFCALGLLLKKMTLQSMIPFAPFLIPGFCVGLILFLH